MVVPIGGFRPVDGGLFYTQAATKNYEYLLLDERSRMLEAQDLRTRQSNKAVIRNYGNIEEEMFAERTTTVTTPNYRGTYSLAQGTPLFLEQMFASNDRYVGLSNAGSTLAVISIGTNRSDAPTDLFVGQEIEINGEKRRVTAVTAPTATTPLIASVASPFSAVPPPGSMVLIKGRDYANPHLNETYRVTDKYNSYIVEENRYQIDRNQGIVRYLPIDGSTAFANSIWHPELATGVPYYFGKMIPVRVTPPPAGPVGDGVTGNETLGDPWDGDNTETSAIAGPTGANSTGPSSRDNGVTALMDTTTLTQFGLGLPDGEYSNILVEAPIGVPFEVELNGSKLAISSGTAQTTGQLAGRNAMLIPFFDPNHENDQLKANDGIDPDVYIQRFVKEGSNNLVIKASQPAGTGSNGIRVEGFFNGVNLTTGPVAATGRPRSSQSVETLDWSVSRHSIMGIVGKIDFDLGDRIALEDVNDEILKAQGVLESLTTLIAGTDLNQFQSMLSVIR